MRYKEHKDQVVKQITKDLKGKSRAIVRGLGTFKLVTYQPKKTIFGKVKARTNIKFRADPKLRKKFKIVK